MNFPQKVRLCEDVTRDGFQSTATEVGVEDKLRILELIMDMGASCIEVGAFSPYESMKLMRNTGEVFKRMKKRDGVQYRALVFAPDGAREAAECGCDRIKINISASDQHHVSGTGMTTAEAMKNFTDIARVAEEKGLGMSGSISLPFRSPFPGEGLIPMEHLCDIIRSFVDIGIREISLSDAAGLGDPGLIYTRFTEVSRRFPEVSWMLHMHNTFGLGLAGVTAALAAGVTKFDSSLAGLGGCPYIKNATGNVATEDLVFMLDNMGIETGIDLQKCIAAGREVEKIVNNRGCDSYVQRTSKSA